MEEREKLLAELRENRVSRSFRGLVLKVLEHNEFSTKWVENAEVQKRVWLELIARKNEVKHSAVSHLDLFARHEAASHPQEVAKARLWWDYGWGDLNQIIKQTVKVGEFHHLQRLTQFFATRVTDVLKDLRHEGIITYTERPHEKIQRTGKPLPRE